MKSGFIEIDGTCALNINMSGFMHLYYHSSNLLFGELCDCALVVAELLDVTVIND